MTDFARDLFENNESAWLVGLACVLALGFVLWLAWYADRLQAEKEAESENPDFWTGGGAL